uniref:Uncharacterized protein n=1 Tax=Romanomermis culicivorax TaxID=13658 RepID=A0A915IVK6_ROMCU
ISGKCLHIVNSKKAEESEYNGEICYKSLDIACYNEILEKPMFPQNLINLSFLFNCFIHQVGLLDSTAPSRVGHQCEVTVGL